MGGQEDGQTLAVRALRADAEDQLWREVYAGAPEEIRSEGQTMVAHYDEIIAARPADFVEIWVAMDDETKAAVERARDRISTFYDTACTDVP